MIDRQDPFLRIVPFGNKRAVKASVLCPPNYHFGTIRKEYRDSLESIREVVQEKEKQEWAYHRALRHWNGPRELFADVYSRDSSTNACFNGDITKARGFRQKKPVAGGVKSLNKIINQNAMNCAAFVHYARHLFFEDQQFMRDAVVATYSIRE